VRGVVSRRADGKPKAEPSLLPALEAEGRTLEGDEVQAAVPDLARFVDPAVAAGTAAAQEELARLAHGALPQAGEEEASVTLEAAATRPSVPGCTVPPARPPGPAPRIQRPGS
jgi:ATP-dependent helicase HepA